MAAEFPEWTGEDPASSAWNEVKLGGIKLPGVWKVDNLEVGIEVKVKKAKGIDKPTSTDCGLDPANMQLEGILTTREWAEFQGGFPSWNPRRPGRERGPVAIEYPLINLCGIKEVRITKIKMQSPTSKEGMKITIYLQEWFDAPVETKEKKKVAKLPKPGYPAGQFEGWESAGPLPDLREPVLGNTGNPIAVPGNPLARLVNQFGNLFK